MLGRLYRPHKVETHRRQSSLYIQPEPEEEDLGSEYGDKGSDLRQPRITEVSTVKSMRMRQAQDLMTPAQKVVSRIMTSTAYELFIGSVVVFNVGLLVQELNVNVACPTVLQCTPRWVSVTEGILLVLYTFDLLGSLFYKRMHFFRGILTWVDLLNVCCGYIEIVAVFLSGSDQSLGAIQMLRIFRVLRLVKVVRPFHDLYRLITGFFFTLRTIFWSFILILLLLLVWSIVILQTFQFLDTDDIFQDPRFGSSWCEDAMASTFSVVLLLWQTSITGDSWSACILPVILKHPAMFFIYATAFVVINIGFTNLILAVIVENASRQMEGDAIREIETFHMQQAKDIDNFRATFKYLDKDGSKTLSLPELLAGLEEFVDFKEDLLKFGITKTDLSEIFDWIGTGHNGEITYMDFVDAMFRSQRQTPDTQLMMLQVAMKSLMTDVKELKANMNLLVRHAGIGGLTSEMGNDSSLSSFVLNGSASLGGATNGISPAVSENVGDSSQQLQRHLEMMDFRLNHTVTVLQQQSLKLGEETRELKSTLDQMAKFTHADLEQVSGSPMKNTRSRSPVDAEDSRNILLGGGDGVLLPAHRAHSNHATASLSAPVAEVGCDKAWKPTAKAQRDGDEFRL